MIEAEAEAVRDLFLDGVHRLAVLGHGLTGLRGGKLGRGAMLVGGADEHDLVTACAHVAGVEIGGKLAAHQIAQMLDPVNVRNGGGDEDA